MEETTRNLGLDPGFGGFKAALVDTTGTRSANVDWSLAKVAPAKLPESLPEPPAWLPGAIVGAGVVVMILLLRRRRRNA